MSYKESQIAHERPNFWVFDTLKGHFEVYRNDATHSTRVAHFGKGCEGGAKVRAIADCNRRQTHHDLEA